MINLRKAAFLSVGSGAALVSSAVSKPKTQKGEKRLNNISTAAGLGAVTALGIVGKDLLKTTKATSFEKVGKYIEKTAEYAKKAANSDTVKSVKEHVSIVAENAKSTKVGKAVADGISKVINKAKTTKAGKAVTEVLTNAINTVKSNKILKNAVTKIGEYVNKFTKAPTAAKGKYALIGAGAALLAYGTYKLVANFFKKEGAIDQTYNDLREQYKHMVQYHPITDARTGKPISFDEYCVAVQTKVY